MRTFGYILLGTFLSTNIISTRTSDIHGECRFVDYGHGVVRAGSELRDNLINVFGFLQEQRSSNIPTNILDYFHKLKLSFKYNTLDVFRLLPVIERLVGRPFLEQFWILSEAIDDIVPNLECEWSCKLSSLKTNEDLLNILKLVPNEVLLHDISKGGVDYLDRVRKFNQILSTLPTVKNATFYPPLMNILEEIGDKKTCFTEQLFGHLVPFYPWPKNDYMLELSVFKVKMFFQSDTADFLQCEIYVQDLYPLMKNPSTLLDYILYKIDSFKCIPDLTWSIDRLVEASQSKPIETHEREFQNVIRYFDVITNEIYPLEILLAKNRLIRYINKMSTFLDRLDFPGNIFEKPEERLIAFLDYLLLDRVHLVDSLVTSIKAIKAYLLFTLGPQRADYTILLTIVDAWNAPDLRDDIRAETQHIKEIISMESNALTAIVKSSPPRFCTGVLNCYMEILNVLGNHPSFQAKVQQLHPPICIINPVLFCHNNTVDLAKRLDILKLLKDIDYDRYSPKAVTAAQKILEFLKENKIIVDGITTFFGCTNEETLITNLENMQSNVALDSIQEVVKYLLKELQSQVTNPEVIGTAKVSPKLTITELDHMSVSTLLDIINDINTSPSAELDFALKLIDEKKEKINLLLEHVNCSNTDKVLTCFNSILTNLSTVDSTLAGTLKFLLQPTSCDKVSCVYEVTVEQGSNVLNPIHNYVTVKLEDAIANATNYLLKNNLLEVLKVVKTQDMRQIYQNLDIKEDALLQFLKQFIISSNVQECARESAKNLIKYFTRKDLPKTLNACILDVINQEMQNMTNNTQVIANLRDSSHTILSNQNEVNKLLLNIAVDCTTLETCIRSLVIDTLADNGAAAKTQIKDMVNPCNESSECIVGKLDMNLNVVKKIVYEINNQLQNSNTPLIIQNQLNSMLEFLKTEDALNLLNEETIKGNTPLLATTTALLKTEVKISPETRETLTKISEYLQEGKLPNKITLEDLTAVLNNLLVTTESKTEKEKIERVVELIDENPEKYQILLKDLAVTCKTLQQCVDEVFQAIVIKPDSEARTTLLEILEEEHNKHQLNNQTIEEFVNKITIELQEELPSTSLQGIMKLVRDRFLTYIKTNDLSDIIFKCMKAHGGTCDLKQVLEEIKESHNTIPDIAKMIEIVQNYQKNHIIPTNIVLPILLEVIESLKKMTTDVEVKNELEEKKHELEMHAEEVSHILKNIVVPCDTIASCVKLLLEEFNKTKNELLISGLKPSSCDKTKCPWLQYGLDDKLLVESQQVFNNIAELLTNSKLNFHIRLDLEQINEELKKEDLTSPLIKILNTQPHNTLLALLEELSEHLAKKNQLKPSVENVIQYLKSGVLPSHLDIKTLGGLLTVLEKKSPNSDIAQHINLNIETITNMLGADNVISKLNVTCDTLENCVNSLVTSIEQSPLENNKVLLVIEDSMKPAQCRKDTCPWLKFDENVTIKLLRDLRSQLIIKTQPSSIPLLIRLYGDEVAKMLNVTDIAKYLPEEADKKTLENLLLGLSQDATISLSHRDVALALYNYLTRQEIPETITVDDVGKIVSEMITKTPDLLAQDQIKTIFKKLDEQANSVNDLLKLCKFSCRQLKSCLEEIKACSQRSIKIVKEDLLTLVSPPNCNIHVCSWMVEEKPSSSIDIVTNVQAALKDIRVAITRKDLPFHLKLDLSHLAAAMQKKEFSHLLKNATQGDSLCLYMGTVTSGKNLTESQGIDALKLLKVIEAIPLKVLYETGIFENVNNIVDYFTKGTLPKYFDVNSFKLFALLLGKRSKNADVEVYMKTRLETVLKLPFLANILSKIPIKCSTVQDCVVSIMKSLEKSPISGYLFNLLSDIIQPGICNRTICNWVHYDSSTELVRSLVALREELEDLTQGDDVLLIIKLYGQQLLKYLTYEHLYPYTKKTTITLKNLLIQMSLDDNNENKVRHMANMIAYYLSGGEIPKKLTHDDFNPLTKEILDNTMDILVKQHIIGYTNRLMRHVDELDNLLSKCTIACTILKVCISQIIACNEQYNSTISLILRLYLTPPSCDRESCPWIPENQLSKIRTTSRNETFGHILFLLPDGEGNMKSVLLDLNDEQVQKTILELTNILGDNPRPLILKIRKSKDRIQHVYLDLMHPQVINALLKLSIGRKQFINMNTMKIVTLTMIRDHHVNAITFDLSNPEVRAKLIEKAKSQTLDNPNLPTIILIDLDGQEYKLTLDWQDIDGLQYLLSASMNTFHTEDDNLVIFYLDDDGLWNALNYGTLSMEAKIRLSKLHGYHLVGSGSSYTMTTCALIPIYFDVYDKHISNELANIDSKYPLIVDVDTQKSLTLMIPDSFGQLQPVRVELSEQNIADILKLSQQPLDSRIKPTFVFKRGSELQKVYLNSESSKVRDFLGSLLTPGEDAKDKQEIISVILQEAHNNIAKLLADNEVPFIVKLSLKQLAKVLQAGPSLEKLEEHLSKLSISNLDEMKKLAGNTGLLPKFLESLSQNFLTTLDLQDNSRDVLKYLNGLSGNNILLPNTFQELVKQLIQQTTDKNVALDIKIHADMLTTLTELKEVLANIPVKCETFKKCIDNFIKGIEFSKVDSSIKHILMDIVTPQKCTNTTCLWVTVSNNYKNEVPETLSEEVQTTVKYLTSELTKALQVLSNNSNIPYHIRLNLDSVYDILSKPTTFDKILEEIRLIPEEYRKEQIKTLMNIAERWKNSQLDVKEFAKLLLRHFPTNFVRRYNFVENVDKILQFFDRGTIPGTLTLLEVEQLSKHIGEVLHIDVVDQYLKNQIADLESTSGINKVLKELAVQCLTFKSCIESLNRALQFTLDDDQIKKKLYSILHPQGCGKTTCDVIGEGTSKDSAFMVLPVGEDKDLVLLDLKNENVVTLLKQLSLRNKSPYPSIIFSLLEGDKRHTISLDLKDITTIHYLSQLQDGTTGEIAPYILEYHNESVIVGRVRNENGDMTSFMIKQDAETYDCFKKFDVGSENCKIKLPFTNGDVCLKEYPKECTNIRIKPDIAIPPPGYNVQPTVVTLPDKQQLTITYDNLITQLAGLNHIESRGEAGNTLLPFVTDKGVVDFVSINLHDKQVIALLKNNSKNIAYVPKPNSVIATTVRDEYGDKTAIILDLNDEGVLNELIRLSKYVDRTSDNLTTVTYVDNFGNAHMITFDLNDLALSKLEELSKKTSENLKPITLKQEDGSQLAAMMVRDSHGTLKPLLLNLTNDYVKNALISMGDSKNPSAVPVAVEGSDGISFNIYSDVKNFDIANRLLELSELTECVNGILLNKNDESQNTQVLLIKGAGSEDIGGTQLLLNTSDDNVLHKLKFLESQSGKNSPTFIFTDARGQTNHIKLDTENPQVIKELKLLADTTTVKTNNILAIKSGADLVVIDVNNPQVANALISLNEQFKSDKGQVFSVINPDTNEATTILIDTKNANVLSILKRLAGKASASLPVVEVEGDNAGQTITIVPVPGPNGKAQFKLLNGSNPNVISQLKTVSELFNPRATTVILHDQYGNAVAVHLDLKNNTIKEILNKLNDELKAFELAPVNLITNTIVSIPVQVKDDQIILNCNLSNSEVFNMLLRYGLQKAIANGKNFAIDIMDKTGIHHKINIDTGDMRLYKKLSKICDHTTKISDLLVLTVKNAGNTTETLVINTKGRNVVQKLEELSNQTLPGHTLTTVQVQDYDGLVHVITLDLENPDVISGLSKLVVSLSRPVLLPGAGADNTLLVLQVENADGTRKTMAFDTKDEETANFLLENSDNLNGIPLDIMTNNGTKRIYLDAKNKRVMSKLQRLMKKTPPHQTLTLKPIINAETVMDIPLVGKNGHSVTVTVDLNLEEVRNIIEHYCLPQSTEGIQTSVTILNKEGKAQTCAIPVNNTDFTYALIDHSISYEYHIEDGSLLVLPIVSQGKGKYIVLDLKNEEVTKVLTDISGTLGKESNRTTITYMDKYGHLTYCDVDLNDRDTQKKLEKLEKFTPSNIRTEIITPFGPKSILVLSYNNTADGKIKSIVIDTNIPEKVASLIKIKSDTPVIPLEIKFIDEDGVQQTFKVDLDNSETRTILSQLSQPNPEEYKEALLNYGQMSDADRELSIIFKNDEGNEEQYTFDVTNDNVVNALVSLAASPTEAATIIYVPNKKGGVTAVRINPKDRKIKTSLLKIVKKKKVKMNSKCVLVLTILNDVYQAETVVLDICNPNVISGLKEISYDTPKGVTASSITLTDSSGKKVPIRLMTNNPQVAQKIKLLMKYTPASSIPIKIDSVLGPQPLIVFTMPDEHGEAKAAVFDLNNPQVVQLLRLLKTADDSNSINIDVVDDMGVPFKVFLNLDSDYVKRSLSRICNLLPYVPGPLDKPSKGPLIITAEDADGKTLELALDITDANVVNQLLDLAESTTDYGSNIVFNIVDADGRIIPIKLDVREPKIVNKLKKIARCNLLPSPNEIRPTYEEGELPLLTFTMTTPEGKLHPITINPNSPGVIESILSLNATYHPVITLKIKTPNGTEHTVYLDNDRFTIMKLDELMGKLPVQVNPIEVTLPHKTKPLLPLLINHKDYSLAVTLDTNSEDTYRTLANLESPDAKRNVEVTFDLADGKKTVNVDLDNPNTMKQLQILTKKNKVFVIPVSGSYPIIAVRLDSGEVIKIDTNNQEAVNAMVELSKNADNRMYPQTEIVFKDQNGINVKVRVAFDNPAIRTSLQRLKKGTPFPRPLIINPTFEESGEGEGEEEEDQKSIEILPSGNAIYPLVSIKLNGSLYTIDINKRETLQALSDLCKLDDGGEKPKTKIVISDVEGNLMKFEINLENPTVQTKIRELAKYCMLALGDKKPLPDVILEIADNFGSKQKITLDLNDKGVLNTLMELSKRYDYLNPYTLEIPTGTGTAVLLIDFNDSRVADRLRDLFKEDKPPLYFSFDVPDPFGKIWKIVLNLENREVMSRVIERSDFTGDTPGAATIILDMPDGQKKPIYLNLNDISAINLLKDLTLLSTGRLAVSVDSQEQKNFFDFSHTDKNGKTLKFTIDGNNKKVMHKLHELSKKNKGSKVTIVKIKTPSGKKLVLKFDFNNAVVLKNLYNLQEESLGGKSVELIDIPRKQTYFEAFDIPLPNGKTAKIKLDLYLPGMTEKLKQLDKEYVPGHQESRVKIATKGNEVNFMLHLDISNYNTLRKLGAYTEESTGIDPIKDQLPSTTIELLAFLTISIPVGIETFQITIDLLDPQVVQKLLRMDNETAAQPCTFNVMDKTPEGEERNNTVTIDTANRTVLNALLEVSYPTLSPTLAPPISLITLIFLPVGDNRYLPIKIDLGEKMTVLHLIKISSRNQRTMKQPSYLDVRDDTGQYLRIPLDLTHPDVISDLIVTWNITTSVYLDSKLLPYLILAIPRAGEAHDVIKFQLKPKVIERVFTMINSNNPNAFPIQLIDAQRKIESYKVDILQPGLAEAMLSIDGVVAIKGMIPRNMLIVPTIDENRGADVNYFNFKNSKTMQNFKRLKYSARQPLTVVQFYENDIYEYFLVDLVNPANLESLSEFGDTLVNLREQLFIQQTVMHTVILKIPTMSSNDEIVIKMNIADRQVLEELRVIGDSYVAVENHPKIQFQVEDMYGFALEIPIDYSNAETIERLKALDVSVREPEENPNA